MDPEIISMLRRAQLEFLSDVPDNVGKQFSDMFLESAISFLTSAMYQANDIEADMESLAATARDEQARLSTSEQLDKIRAQNQDLLRSYDLEHHDGDYKLSEATPEPEPENNDDKKPLIW